MICGSVCVSFCGHNSHPLILCLFQGLLGLLNFQLTITARDHYHPGIPCFPPDLPYPRGGDSHPNISFFSHNNIP